MLHLLSYAGCNQGYDSRLSFANGTDSYTPQSTTRACNHQSCPKLLHPTPALTCTGICTTFPESMSINPTCDPYVRMNLKLCGLGAKAKEGKMMSFQPPTLMLTVIFIIE